MLFYQISKMGVGNIFTARSMPHQAHQRQVEGQWKNKRIGQDAAANKRI